MSSSEELAFYSKVWEIEESIFVDSGKSSKLAFHFNYRARVRSVCLIWSLTSRNLATMSACMELRADWTSERETFSESFDCKSFISFLVTLLFDLLSIVDFKSENYFEISPKVVFILPSTFLSSLATSSSIDSFKVSMFDSNFLSFSLLVYPSF